MAGLVGQFRDKVAEHGAVGVALALTVAWLAMVGGFWLLSPAAEGPVSALSWLMSAVGVILPIALIWMAAAAAEALAALRVEAQHLRAELERMRAPDAAPVRRSAPVDEVIIDDLAPAAEAPALRVAAPAAPRPASVPRAAQPQRAARPVAQTAAPVAASAAAQQQGSLALDLPGEGRAAIEADQMIRALNFPEGPDDAAGIAALRAALADPVAARLVRAAQDVLTLLARDGIFMDDLATDRARPELWRRFATGERGREVSSLGGVRDRTTLALVQDLLRSDTIFRDAAHHFLRQYDRALTAFEPQASDAQLVALAETRTARAFMLLGRAAGTFD